MDWGKLAAMVVCAGGLIGVVWLFKAYLWAAVSPFVFAWLLSLCIVPLARRLSVCAGGKQKMWAVLLLILFLLLFSALTMLLTNRLYRELEGLFRRLTEDGSAVGDVIDRISDWIERLSTHIPWFERMRQSGEFDTFLYAFDENVKQMIYNTISDIAGRVPDMAIGLIGGIPSFFLVLTVFLLALFYFCVDAEKISTFAARRMPPRLLNRLRALRSRLGGTLLHFGRAYLLIMLITFAELYVGFLLIGVDYALIMAALTALVDLLPVLGTGTVMLPWAAGCLILGNVRTGIGLLVLYGVESLIRQLIEPRIVGKSVGLPPLVALIAMFVGFRLYGVGGMLAGPLIAILVRTWIRVGRGDPDMRETTEAEKKVKEEKKSPAQF